MNNLERLTGQSNWANYLAESVNKKIKLELESGSFKGSIEQWFQLLVNGEYPTKYKELPWVYGEKKNTFLYSDGTSLLSDESQIFTPINKLQKPSSLLTLMMRFNSSNLRGESPIIYLANHGDQFLVSLYNALRETMDEQTAIDNIKENLLDYVVQFFQEKKMLVNTFPYWRIWSFMGERIAKAIAIINEGGDIKQLVQLCGTFDPTAGWGCRLVSVLLVKAFLLKQVRQSGNYSDSKIQWFINSTFYVGCDTNFSLQLVYAKLRDIICEMYGLSINSSMVYCVDCISDTGISIAELAINNEITLLQTSIPTPWEIYRNSTGEISNGDSLLTTDFSIGSEDLHAEHRKWISDFLYPFISKLVGRFSHGQSCAIIHVDGYTVNHIKNGKPCKFKCELGKDLAKIAKSLANNVSEICSAWDDPIKSMRCKCSDIACGNCESCKKYSVCGVVKCDQKTKCYSYQLRSGFIISQ